MNNKEFISALARSTGRSQEDTQKLVGSLVSTMSELFDDGENITIANFGTFEVKKRMERIIINPSSGQRMLVPPKLVLSFKPAAMVKESIRKGGGE